MIDPRLPLTDIHRHLDGNIRAQTILDLGRRFNLSLPADELEALRPHVQITKTEPDLVSFLQKLDWGVAVLGSLEACRRVAYENVEDAANAGLHYAELRFSPFYMAMKHQLPVAGVVEAVIDGINLVVVILILIFVSSVFLAALLVSKPVCKNWMVCWHIVMLLLRWI